MRWGWFEARRAGSRADGKGVLRHAWVSVCPSWLWAGVQGRQTGRHRRRASTGFHPLPPVSQKTGEQLVTSMLCSELFLQSCSLTRSSRTLLCPLWTLESQRTRLSKRQRHLRAGPVQIVMQMKDDVKLKTSLPCNQGLNGHKPPASIHHIVPTYSLGTCPTEPISTPVLTPRGHGKHK